MRPHDLDLHAANNGGAGSLPARVLRVQTTGPVVRVELVLDSGDRVRVDLSHERYGELGVNASDRVFISPREARVFVEDYVI